MRYGCNRFLGGVTMSKPEPYFLDDKLIIPKEVKEMSKKQIEQEIARIEEKERAEKKRGN